MAICGHELTGKSVLEIDGFMFDGAGSARELRGGYRALSAYRGGGWGGQLPGQEPSFGWFYVMPGAHASSSHADTTRRP